MNFVVPILHHARSKPETAAIVDGVRSTTYAGLADQVRRTATHLSRIGVRPGDRVAICLNDGAGHVIALLAAAFLGAVATPVDWRARPHEKARILRQIGCSLAVADRGAAFPAPCPVVACDEIWERDVAASAPAMAPGAGWLDPFLITGSSGTTGLPKYTVVSHAQAYLRAMDATIVRVAGQIRTLSTFPLAFAAGRSNTLNELARGATVIVMPHLISGADFVAAVHDHRANAAYCSATLVRQMLDLAPGDRLLLPGLAALQTSATPMSPADKCETVRRVTQNYFETFGTTAAGMIAILRPGDLPERADSVGQVSALVDAEVVDERGVALGRGETGQLRVRGPKVASPLLADGAEENEEFRHGWHYTGDLAMLDARMYLYIKGRTAEVIERRGAKIFPAEIENALREHPAVVDVAAVNTDGPGGLVAFVVAREPTTPGALLAFCRARLPPYKIPDSFRFLSNLPRTEAGKVDRRALKADPPA